MPYANFQQQILTP